MSINFAANLNKMITAGLGGAVDAPATHVAVGYHVESETLSGNPVTFSDGDGIKSLMVSFSPVQAEGTPSPGNLLPISGWSAINVWRSGKNMLPMSLPDNMISGTISSGRIAGASNAKIFAIPVPKNTTITVQKSYDDGGAGTIGLGDTGEIAVGTDVPVSYAFTGVKQHTFSTGGHGWIYIQTSSLYLTNAWWTTRQLMVSVANGRQSYVAPSGYAEISAQLGSTYYGGTVDVVSGEGSSTWGYIASYNGETLPGEWISDRDVYAEGTSPTTGAEVAYELADPISFTISPQSLTTLEGNNTLWTDADSIDLTYWNINYTEGY